MNWKYVSSCVVLVAIGVCVLWPLGTGYLEKSRAAAALCAMIRYEAMRRR